MPTIHRSNFTKGIILSKYGGDPDKTEWENMQDMGYDRIWDCGSACWELDI